MPPEQLRHRRTPLAAAQPGWPAPAPPGCGHGGLVL